MFLHQVADTACHLLQASQISHLKLLGRNLNSLTSASTQRELARVLKEAMCARIHYWILENTPAEKS